MKVGALHPSPDAPHPRVLTGRDRDSQRRHVEGRRRTNHKGDCQPAKAVDDNLTACAAYRNIERDATPDCQEGVRDDSEMG